MARLLDKCLISACAALAFTAVSAAVSDDFESTDAGATPDGWTGNATVAAETYTYSKAVGLPLTGDEQKHEKVLSVSGQAVRTYTIEESATYKTATVDMMVKVMAADDVPDAPDTTSDIQVAIATGAITDGSTKAPIYIYKTVDSETAWVATGKSYETNTWVRLMMVMNYDNSKCTVTIDGDVIDTVAFVGTPTVATQVSNITVEGLTSLDDVVLTPSTDSATDITPFPSDAKSETATVGDEGSEVYVKLNWLYKNGLDGDTVTMSTECSDDSGMTYAQKYEAGLDIDDGQKFEVTSMTVKDANTAAFTVPGEADAYEVVIDADGATNTLTPTTSTKDGVTTATVDLTGVSGKVIKFQLKAKAE